MFHLAEATKHTLTNMNVRSETHGKEHITAVDLKFMAAMPGSVLDLFDADMRETFYTVGPEGTLTKLRHAKLLPLGWEQEYTGRAVTLDYGLGDDGTKQLEFGDGRTSNLQLIGVKLAKFRFTPQEGGTVILEYRAQIAKVEAAAVGLLSSLLKHSVWLILPVPAEAHPVGQEPAGDPRPDGPAADDLVSRAQDEQGDHDGEAGPVAGDGGEGDGGDGAGAGGPADNDTGTEDFIAAHTVAGTAAAEAKARAAGTRRGTRRPS
jgi:hypothetical protein